MTSATPQLINPNGTSYVLVAYHGDIAQLAAALSGRGWQVDFSGTSSIHLAHRTTIRRRFRRHLRRRQHRRRRAAAAGRSARAASVKPGPDQIALPLDWPQTEGDARFIVSDANRTAFEHFQKWSMWPVKATILTGPRRSGRTLLARSFVERVGGRLFDDAESRDETELFHAWNDAQDSKRPLVMIADQAPPAWTPSCPISRPG